VVIGEGVFDLRGANSDSTSSEAQPSVIETSTLQGPILFLKADWLLFGRLRQCG
jgi:hypothetical protein